MLPLSAYLSAAAPPAPAGHAPAPTEAGRDAAVWFADGLGGAGRTLHAPAAFAPAGDANALAQRFIASLCEPG